MLAWRAGRFVRRVGRECGRGLYQTTLSHVSTVYQGNAAYFVFFTYSIQFKSDDDNVRNNATFGIGVLIACGGATGATLIERFYSKTIEFF